MCRSSTSTLLDITLYKAWEHLLLYNIALVSFYMVVTYVALVLYKIHFFDCIIKAKRGGKAYHCGVPRHLLQSTVI